MSADGRSVRGSAAARRVEVERVIAAPIGEVWAALTDAQAISQWFTDAVIDAREGGRMELSFGQKTTVTCTIKAFMPPHVLAYTWEQEGESTSWVQFDLIELSAGETQVTVVQTALDAGVAGDVVDGWNEMLDRLMEYSRSSGAS